MALTRIAPRQLSSAVGLVQEHAVFPGSATWCRKMSSSHPCGVLAFGIPSASTAKKPYFRPCFLLRPNTRRADADFVKSFSRSAVDYNAYAPQDGPQPLVTTGLRGWWNLNVKTRLSKASLQSYRTSDLKRSALVMYSCCTDPVNYVHFFKVLGLPDTFNSWFKITELHVWMCLVRLSVESYDGQAARKEIVEQFWRDVDKRSLLLGPEAMALRKKHIRLLYDQYRANLYAYDEGFLLDDKVLAAALWRNFFGKQCDDPRKVELLVAYVRKQLDNLEQQDRYTLLSMGIVRWLPVSEVAIPETGRLI